MMKSCSLSRPIAQQAFTFDSASSSMMDESYGSVINNFPLTITSSATKFTKDSNDECSTLDYFPEVPQRNDAPVPILYSANEETTEQCGECCYGMSPLMELDDDDSFEYNNNM